MPWLRREGWAWCVVSEEAHVWGVFRLRAVRELLSLPRLSCKDGFVWCVRRLTSVESAGGWQ